MDKLTKKIFTLNKVYNSMKDNFDILKKLFNKDSNIQQKFILSESILNQAYMIIKDKIESQETNKQFNKIIKNIKKEK